MTGYEWEVEYFWMHSMPYIWFRDRMVLSYFSLNIFQANLKGLIISFPDSADDKLNNYAKPSMPNIHALNKSMLWIAVQ